MRDRLALTSSSAAKLVGFRTQRIGLTAAAAAAAVFFGRLDEERHTIPRCKVARKTVESIPCPTERRSLIQLAQPREKSKSKKSFIAYTAKKQDEKVEYKLI